MNSVHTAELLIRLGIGIVMILFGLNQILKPAKWQVYIPGFLRFIMPFKPTSFLRLHGSLNVLFGILLAVGIWQPVSIWIAAIWWTAILPFAFFYAYSVGLRDAAIIMSLVALLVLYYR